MKNATIINIRLSTIDLLTVLENLEISPRGIMKLKNRHGHGLLEIRYVSNATS